MSGSVLKLAGTHARPALEGTGKVRWIRVADGIGDLDHLFIRFSKQLRGYLEARLLLYVQER